jgi:diacylglycerol kinase (ATP)
MDCRVIICGGDGTIPWVLAELLGAGVKLERVVIGIIPIGTGNDFSRSLGWGSECLKISPNNFTNLGNLVK